MAEVSVITVTYNNEGSIKVYLDSLRKNISKNFEVIIVDNSSSDKTLEILSQEKDIEVIKNSENLGFGRANNMGVKKANGEYLLFLNPDASLETGFAEALEYLKKNISVGILAPKLMEGKTPQKSVRKLPTILGAFREYFLQKKNQYEAYVPEGNEPLEVESVVGAGMLLSKKVFESSGGFDGKYFMYFEDLDLCRKIGKMGLKIIYYPNWVVNHIVGFSKDERKGKWLIDSAKKYHGSFYFFILNLLLKLRPNM